jgi:hypothetical protein
MYAPAAFLEYTTPAILPRASVASAPNMIFAIDPPTENFS